MIKKDAKLILCKDSNEPDRELLLWEKWIQIRKEETERLATRTERSPAELVMNLCEQVRDQKERKEVLQHAQIDEKVGVRESLWDQPERLKQQCYCKPVYEIQRTRAEMGRPRIIQHIGVPRHIQETEKGIKGSQRKPCIKLDSEYVSYRDKREKDLADKVKKIDPYRPDLDELIVIGNKSKPPPKKMPLIPSITFTLTNESPPEDLCTVYALRINNTVFLKEKPHHQLSHLKQMQSESWHENCDSWSYYFNCPINRVGRSKLFLQNLGTVTLRYCWRKIKLTNIDDSQDQVFFFNKNENVICPGQSREVFFTFISNLPGTYGEAWELMFMNVCFFDSLEQRLTVNLYADSVENLVKIKKKSDKLQNIIYINVLKNIARELIGEIIIKATSVKPQIYPYEKLFLEADMFTLKNPVCFYHQTEVLKMKETYKELTSGQDWDLSINTWRAAMMKKEFDDRMKYYGFLRNSHRECLKPWYEENDLPVQKYKAVNQILCQLADKFDEEFARIPRVYYNLSRDRVGSSNLEEDTLLCSSSSYVRHIFYLHAYDHVIHAMELCAGILSSLDLNRWIQFDFCRT